MGAKGLLGELLGGDAEKGVRVGFSKLETLRNCLADIDTGMLIFMCALERKYKELYKSTLRRHGDY